MKANRSAITLKPARNFAGGLNHEMKIIEIPKAVIIPKCQKNNIDLV